MVSVSAGNHAVRMQEVKTQDILSPSSSGCRDRFRQEYGEKESSRVKNTKKEYSSLYCGACTKFANSAIRMMQYTMHTKTEKTKSSQRLFQPQT